MTNIKRSRNDRHNDHDPASPYHHTITPSFITISHLCQLNRRSRLGECCCSGGVLGSELLAVAAPFNKTRSCGLVWVILVSCGLLATTFWSTDLSKEKAKELLGSKRLAVAAPFIGNFGFPSYFFFPVNLIFGVVKEGRQNNLFLTIQKHLI